MSLFVSILLALVSGPHCGGGAVRQLYRDSRHQIQNTGYSDTGDNHICRDIAPVDTALCTLRWDGYHPLTVSKDAYIATVRSAHAHTCSARPNIKVSCTQSPSDTGQPRPGPRSECPIVIYRHLASPSPTHWAGWCWPSKLLYTRDEVARLATAASKPLGR